MCIDQYGVTREPNLRLLSNAKHAYGLSMRIRKGWQTIKT